HRPRRAGRGARPRGARAGAHAAHAAHRHQQSQPAHLRDASRRHAGARARRVPRPGGGDRERHWQPRRCRTDAPARCQLFPGGRNPHAGAGPRRAAARAVRAGRLGATRFHTFFMKSDREPTMMYALRCMVTSSLLVAWGAAAAAGLGLEWELEGLRMPESVIYDGSAKVLYVTSMDGSATEKDGNGYISKVGTDGTMQVEKWATGLHAPKGMAIHGGRLYVADVDAIAEIDIASGKVLNRYEDASAKFMNDVAAGPDGTIYASDTAANRIYRLRDGKLEVWLEDSALKSPNGLFVDGSRLLVGAMGGFGDDAPLGDFLAVSLEDKSITTLS